MFFEQSDGMSINPQQDFMWVADYFDKSYLLEFGKDSIENSFYDIKKSELTRYGLIGCGHKMFFDTKTGIFNISGRSIELEYIDVNGSKYNLTNSNVIYNDILQFKDAESNFNPAVSHHPMSTSVNQFNFGYKQKLKFNDIDLNLKVICKVPYDRPVYLEISLTSSKQLDGRLILKRDGSIIDEVNAPLKEGMKGTINWDII
jgi:hypothetical protein